MPINGIFVFDCQTTRSNEITFSPLQDTLSLPSVFPRLFKVIVWETAVHLPAWNLNAPLPRLLPTPRLQCVNGGIWQNSGTWALSSRYAYSSPIPSLRNYFISMLEYYHKSRRKAIFCCISSRASRATTKQSGKFSSLDKIKICWKEDLVRQCNSSSMR